MPGPYGVVPSGFNLPTLEEITAEIEASVRLAMNDQSIDLNPETSVLGQLVQIVAERELTLWQAAQAVMLSSFPSGAGGVLLDQNTALTGTVRKAAQATIVQVTLTPSGGAGDLPADVQVGNPDAPDATFALKTPAIVLASGGTQTLEFECINTGPIPAYAGTITVFRTPGVTLWSVENATDHDQIGTNSEQDPSLRLRRESEIRGQGGAAFEAIRAKVLKVPGVQDAFCFENGSDQTQDTIPPHSFEVVVRGGDSAAIAKAIYDTKAFGISPFGSTSDTVIGKDGASYTIPFTRPTELTGYVKLTVYLKGPIPENFANTVKQAIASWGDTYLFTGGVLHAQAILPTVFALLPQGRIVDVSPPKLATTAIPPTLDAIVPTKRQIVDLDTSRIDLTVQQVSEL